MNAGEGFGKGGILLDKCTYGGIAPGLRADLCAFDPDAETPVRTGDLRHRHRVSPYEGATVRGAALQTWVAGVPVLETVAA